MKNLVIYFWHLPRWFGLPVSTCAVVLGGLVSGATASQLAIAAGIGALLMAYAHTFNTFNDYVLTGFDKGDVRSRQKPYTSGQSLIALGLIRPGRVFWTGVLYLVLALGLVFALGENQIKWIPVLLTIPMTFAYSYGKKFYTCELVLALGFGPFAAMLGSAFSDHPDMWNSFLVGLPIGIIFGFGAEVYDQYFDADQNWDKGLRNIGALTWFYKLDVTGVVETFVILAYVVQVGLVYAGYLSSWTLLTILALPAILALRLVPRWGSLGILVGLFGVFAYCVLMVGGQAVG